MNLAKAMNNKEHTKLSEPVLEQEVDLQEKDISRKDVHLMFDRIAHRYDFLNHFLSANLDKKWRKQSSLLLPDKANLDILDLATGTADQLISHVKLKDVRMAIGIDPSEQMLSIGREKITKLKLDHKIKLIKGNAELISLEDNSIDAISISFGIRNVEDVDKGLSEMYRVLRPNSKVIILEFSLPLNQIIRNIYLFYFRIILPKLGSLISGDSKAYSYLNQTAESFPSGDEFLSLMIKAGFTDVSQQQLTFGIVSIYSGVRA